TSSRVSFSPSNTSKKYRGIPPGLAVSFLDLSLEPWMPPSARLLDEVEVGRIEFGEAVQPVDVRHGDHAAAPRQHAGAAQLLDRPVHMHQRQADHVGDVGLGGRKLEAFVTHEAEDIEARVELADQVGDVPRRRAAPEAGDPGTLDGGV